MSPADRKSLTIKPIAITIVPLGLPNPSRGKIVGRDLATAAPACSKNSTNESPPRHTPRTHNTSCFATSIYHFHGAIPPQPRAAK
jgi:hypothetical protein